MRNQSVVYVQRMGGWGGRRDSTVLVASQDPPKRPPDASMTEKTTMDQVRGRNQQSWCPYVTINFCLMYL